MRTIFITANRQEGKTNALIKNFSADIVPGEKALSVFLWPINALRDYHEKDLGETLESRHRRLGGHRYLTYTHHTNGLKALDRSIRGCSFDKVNIYVDDCTPKTYVKVKEIFKMFEDVSLVITVDGEALSNPETEWYKIF